MCFSIRERRCVSINVPFSSTVWLFGCRVMYAAVSSAAAFLTAVQSVWLNLRIFLCGFLVLDYPPIPPMFVCVGCIVHVNYRNWNILPECDAWTVYCLGKWICRCFPCMAAERYGGQSHCRVRGENSIIVIASAFSRYRPKCCSS